MQLLGFQISRNSGPSAPQRRSGSPENPSTSLSNPDTWLWDSLGASSGGGNVTAKTALGIAAYSAAVGRRARTIGSLSCKVYKKTELGTEPDYEHPLFSLLNRQPHPLYNSYLFFQTLITNLDLYGKAFAEIVRDGSGNVKLFKLHEPKNVDDLQVTPSGNYFFIVREDHPQVGQNKRPVALANMIVLTGLTFDGYTGLNPMSLYKDTFSGGIANKEYIANFYQNGAHINYAIETPFDVNPQARANIMSEWKRLFTGLKNAFKRPFLLDKGAKLHPLKMTPADAQSSEAQKNIVDEVARIADVPAHVIGGGDHFTFSSVEMMQIDFVQYSLRNTIRQLEIELENKCLSSMERNERSHEIRFNLDSLLQGDIKTRTEKGINEVKWGLITVNEYRRLNGYNEMQGGDVTFNPINMFVTKEGETPANPAFEPQPAPAI